MHRPPQSASAFAVDNSDVENTLFPTCRQIVGHQVLYLLRIEGMKIQNAVNWQFNRLKFIHFVLKFQFPHSFIENASPTG